MIKKKFIHTTNIVIIALIFAGFFGCKSGETITPIRGVWEMEKYINVKDINDDDFYGEQFPTLFDFRSNGELLKINLGYRDTAFSFQQIDNSILKVQGQKVIIHKHNDRELILKYIEHNDTLLAYFKKPLTAAPDVNLESLKSILTANRWTILDAKGEIHTWMDDFELFKNGVGVFRCQLDNGADNLQEELWGIQEYDGSYYFYLKSDIMIGNGNINLMYQILKASEGSLIVYDHYSNQELIFKTLSFDDEKYKKNIENIVGNWRCKNDTSETYWKYISERKIKSGRHLKFDGVLEYNILKDGTIEIKVGENEVEKAKWTLSKDSKVLLLEYEIVEENYKGKHYEYCDILSLSENTMNVKLYDYVHYTHIDKPIIYLNLTQYFKKER